MIFSDGLCEKVIAGTKTQTRRLAKAGPEPDKFESCAYRPGREYAVQPGRGKPAVGRLRVLHVSLVKVVPISPADALAEGFESPGEFYVRWRKMYGIVSGLCWRIEFEMVEDGDL